MVKRWLDGHIQEVMVNESCLTWSFVRSGKLQGAVLRPVLVNIFITELEDVIEHICIK